MLSATIKYKRKSTYKRTLGTPEYSWVLLGTLHWRSDLQMDSSLLRSLPPTGTPYLIQLDKPEVLGHSTSRVC